jgi:hypothetical protein
MNKKCVNSHAGRAVCFIMLEHYKEAINNLDIALGLEPLEPIIYIIKAAVFYLMAHFESSRQNLQTFADIYNADKLPKTNNSSLDQLNRESSQQLYLIVNW